VDWPFELSRPLAGDGRPFGDHLEADDLRADRQIMEHGWNPKIGAFTQHYDT
jgi:hypothetical protein